MSTLTESEVEVTFDFHAYNYAKLRRRKTLPKLSLAEVKVIVIWICKRLHGGVPGSSHTLYGKLVVYVDAGMLSERKSLMLSDLYGSKELLAAASLPPTLVRVCEYETVVAQIALRRIEMKKYNREPDHDSRQTEEIVDARTLIVGIGEEHFIGALARLMLEERGKLAEEQAERIEAWLLSFLHLGLPVAGRGKGVYNHVHMDRVRIFPDMADNLIGRPKNKSRTFTTERLEEEVAARLAAAGGAYYGTDGGQAEESSAED